MFFGCKIEVTAQEARHSRRPLYSSTDSEPRGSLSHSSPGKGRSQIQSMSPPPAGLRNEKDCKKIVRTPRSPASSRSSSVGGDIPEPDLISRKSSLEDGTDFQKENQKRFSSMGPEAINDPRDILKRRMDDDADSLSDDSDKRHQERKNRLLACIEPKNVSGKDRPTTSSSRTSLDSVRTLKTSQSVESSDDLAEEVLEIVRNKQINLKDVTDKTLLTILERLSAENVDASRSSSDGSDSRPSRSQGIGKKPDKGYPRVNLTDDRVNPNLIDPRRRPPCESWLTNSSSPTHLLNPSCRDHPSLKRQQNISEPSVDSTGMSSPKDVSSTSLKSECDDLVSSSSDRPPAKTPMSLPLPEFAVLLLGATTFTNSSSLVISSKIEHLIPGSVQTVIAPLVIHGHPSLATSPKNISITSPLNTFSPLPGKRLRESTESKGSEVSTSDRDSLETVNEIVVKHDSIEFEKCSSPTKGPTVISGDLSIEDRIRALDKKFTAWSSSTGSSSNTVVAPAATISSCPVPIGVGMKQQQQEAVSPATTIDYSKYNIKKKSQVNTSTAGDGSSRNEPSEIGKFFMSKTSIFDQDSKRLEHINEKYEPKDSSLEAPVHRTVIRTKAEAKEFAPPTDRTSSESRTKGPNVPLNHSHPSLGSIQRKLPEPSKIPANLKREAVGPSTPQSAPSRLSSSTPFGIFPSPSSSTSAPTTPSEPIQGKNPISAKKVGGQSIGTEKGPRDPRREAQPESKGLVKKEPAPLSATLGQNTKKDISHSKDSKGNAVKQPTSSSTPSSSSGTGRGPLNVPSHAKVEAGKSSLSKGVDSESISKSRRVSSDQGQEAGAEIEHPPKNNINSGTDNKVKSKPLMMGLSKESLENSTKKKAKEGKSTSFETSKSLERSKSFEKSLKKFEASSKILPDSKNGKVSDSKNVSIDSKSGLPSKSSFKDKQKQLLEKSKLRAAKLKEKQKEKEKAEEKKRKNRKYASELKKLGIDLSDPPVFHSMYDKVKQRSCQRTVPPPETSMKPSKSDSKSSKRDNSSDSSNSDSSSSSSDQSEPIKKTKKRRVIATSSSSSSSSSSSDEKSSKTKSKLLSHSSSHGSSSSKVKAPRVVSSDSDSDDDRHPVKSLKVKKGKRKMKQHSKSYSSEGSSSDSDTPRHMAKKTKLKSKSSSSDDQEAKERKSKSGLDMSKVKKQQMLMKEKMMKKSLEKSSSSSSKNLLSPNKKQSDMREGKSGKSSSFASLSMFNRLKEKKASKIEKKEKEAAKERDRDQIRSKSESDGKSHSESKLSSTKSSKKMKLSEFKKEDMESKKEKTLAGKKSSSSRDKDVSPLSSSSSEKHNSSDNEMRSDFSDSERNFRLLEKVMQSDSDETENNSGKIRSSKNSHSKSSMSSGVISQTEWERSECGKSDNSSVTSNKPSHSNTGFKSPKKATHSPEVSSETPTSSKAKKDIMGEKNERKQSPSPILHDRRKTSSSSSSEFNQCHRSSPTPVVSSTSDILASCKHHLIDDSSSSSSEDKLNEDLSKEARLSAERAEHLAESDASNDDLLPDPLPIQPKPTKEREDRRFELEAAIESQRLEKMMYKDWKESHEPVFNHEEEEQEPSESDANSIFSNDVKQSEIKELTQDDGSNFDDIEPRIAGKEIEVDQRLIEEASAVTALLQEMEYPPETSAEAESAIDNIPYIAIEEEEVEEPAPLQIADETESNIPVQSEKVVSPLRRSSQEGSTANVELELETGQVIKCEHAQHSNKSLSLASGLESLRQPAFVDVPTKRVSSAFNDPVKEEKSKLLDKSDPELLPEPSGITSPVKPVDETASHFLRQQFKQESDVSEDTDSNIKDELKLDDQKEQEKPKPGRGRRAKPSKSSESNTPGLECSNNEQEASKPVTAPCSQTTPSKRLGSKTLIPTPIVRRSPRVAGIVEPESSQHENESGDDGLIRTSGAEDQAEDSEGQKKKRGRKKKISGDVLKTEQVDHKPQKEKIIMSIPVSSTQDKMAPSERKNLSAYDVFEFRDSDDEFTPPPPLEVIHPKPGEVQKAAEEKEFVEEPVCIQEGELRDTKEETSEMVHPKLSITIRLHQKEGTDGNSGTAEVIKTSKALNPDTSKTTTVTSTATAPVIAITPLPTLAPVTAINESQEDSAAEQAKAIRKSARLMSQNKNTVDEVIEDVIKEMNKEGPEAFRLRRYSRLTRRSEDSEEEQLEDPDSQNENSGSVKTYRVTRSSTRGSTGSEGSDTQFVADEAPQITQRRHSHPTPSKVAENATRSSLEQELFVESPANREVNVDEPSKESEAVSVIQEVTSNTVKEVISQSPVAKVTIAPAVLTATITAAETEVNPKEVVPPAVIPLPPSVIQETTRNVVIPSISERIHNSTTALKLKTGKGFILDEASSEYYRGPSDLAAKANEIGISSNVTTTTPSAIPRIESGSEKIFVPSQPSFDSQKSAVHPPPAHTKITIEPKQSSIPASVVTSQTGHLERSKVVAQAENLMRLPPTSSEIADIFNNPSLTQHEKQFLLGRLERIGSPVILQAPTASSPAAGSVGNVAQLPPQSLSGGLQPRIASSMIVPGSSHLPPLHPDVPFGYPQMVYGNHPFALHPSSPHDMHVRTMPLQPGFPTLHPQSIPEPSRKDRNEKDDKSRKGDARVDYRNIDEHDQRRNPDTMPPPPVMVGIRMPLPGYPGGPRHPTLVSPSDRFTDSPAVIHGYQPARVHPSSVHGMHIRPEGMDVPMHVSPAAKSEERRAQHQPYSGQLDLQRPHGGMPTMGSPAPGYLEIRPAHQAALSPGSHSFQRSNHPSPMDNARKSVGRSGYGHKDVNSPLSLNLNSPHGPAYHVHQGQMPLEDGLLRRAFPPQPHLPSEASLPPLGPPPAHIPAPISQPMMAPQTFPQAQVPSGGDSFLLQRYPVVWQGLLALKNDQAAVQMHFIGGSKEIAQASLPPILPEEGVASPVRISQRMRLEPTQLEGVAKKMQVNIHIHLRRLLNENLIQMSFEL